jgi:hypothetical protein
VFAFFDARVGDALDSGSSFATSLFADAVGVTGVVGVVGIADGRIDVGVEGSVESASDEVEA